jgi:branched-subunit amino acid ABC-type transport system permease component
MQLVINALIAGSLAALIAGGLALVYGVLGIFNLALGQMVLVGGYVTWWLHIQIGLPLGVAIIGGLVWGAFLAWLCYLVFIQPFYKRHRFLPVVTTIAFSMILDGMILLFFEERPRSILPGTKTMFEVGSGRVSVEQCILILVTLSVIAGFAYMFHSTSLGRRIRAVVQHDHAALSVGISAPTLHQFVFISSGVFAAAGGIFIGIDQTLTPTLAFSLTIKAYAAIIAGGKGNIWGAIVCAYLIALLEQLLVGIQWFGSFYVPAGYQGTVALLFIIVILLVKPTGLFASASRTT